MAHIASIRFTKGVGDAAIYVRARDATARYWNWTALTWGDTELAACRQTLTERADSDAVESRYMATVSLPPGVQSILEYVLAADATVLGEEMTIPQAVIQVAGTIPSSPDPELCAVYDYLRDQDGTAQAGETGTATIIALPANFFGSLFIGEAVTATADISGIIQWTLPRGATVWFKIKSYGFNRRVVVPAAASVRLATLTAVP